MRRRRTDDDTIAQAMHRPPNRVDTDPDAQAVRDRPNRLLPLRPVHPRVAVDIFERGSARLPWCSREAAIPPRRNSVAISSRSAPQRATGRGPIPVGFPAEGPY